MSFTTWNVSCSSPDDNPGVAIAGEISGSVNASRLGPSVHGLVSSGTVHRPPPALIRNCRVKNFSGPPSFLASASIRVAAMRASTSSLAMAIE